MAGAPVGDDALADLADLTMDIARALVRATRGSGAEGLPGDALTQNEVALVRYIHRHPGCSPSAVARETGLQRSNVSTGVRVLEGKGLVVRTEDEADSRWTRLWTTPLAAADLAAVRARWARLVRDALDDEPAGLGELTELLVRLDAGLTRGRSAPE